MLVPFGCLTCAHIQAIDARNKAQKSDLKAPVSILEGHSAGLVGGMVTLERRQPEIKDLLSMPSSHQALFNALAATPVTSASSCCYCVFQPEGSAPSPAQSGTTSEAPSKLLTIQPLGSSGRDRVHPPSLGVGLSARSPIGIVEDH